MGMSVDEILTSLSHLTSSQVHSALAYYFDHQEEIDRDLEESSEKEYWQQQVLSHPQKAKWKTTLRYYRFKTAFNQRDDP